MPRFFDEFGREVDPYAPDVADNDDDDDDNLGQPPQRRNPLRDQVRRLERANRDLRKQVDELAPQAKELTFVKAGVDMDNPLTPYLVAGYKGDLTPEAVKSAAEGAGLLKQPPGQQQGQPQQQQAPGVQQMPQPGLPQYQQPGQQQQQPQGVQDAFQQAQTAYRAMAQAGDASMPGTRNYDAEMQAAAAAGNQAEVNRLYVEKVASTNPGIPAIVND